MNPTECSLLAYTTSLDWVHTISAENASPWIISNINWYQDVARHFLIGKDVAKDAQLQLHVFLTTQCAYFFP